MTNASPVQPGDILAQKYRVDRVLGVGGMGVVVQAMHMQLDERVALKFMLPEAMANAEISGRFLREARLAVKLKSEHVAKVMDVGTLETGSPYIVMEFLEGTDLSQLLDKHGPLPFADVAEYVIQACDAVAEAHALGIVHRDLKPANLFLTRRPDGAPLVKVLDFGISKASTLTESAGSVTKTSAMMGSPYFMSPEQMRSAKEVDARSDVWSLGVILYQLLTARLPFEADTLGGIMSQVFTDDPPTLSTYRPDVPHAFEAIVRRCLMRDRNQRAQSVGEIAMTLCAYAPARARPIADRIVTMGGGPTKSATGGGTMVVTGAATPGATTGSGPAAHPGLRSIGAAGPMPANATTGAPVTTLARKGSSGLGVAAGAVAVVAAAVGIWWFTRAPSASTQPTAEPPASAQPSSEAAATPPPAPSPSASTPPPAPTVSAAETAAAPVAETAPQPPAVPEKAAGAAKAQRRAPAAPPPPSAPPKKKSGSVLDDRN